jgi:2-keto-3-deoxy-L-rhamnonate aldolase RhmA
MRILINNGLVFYATWVTVATNLNLAIALTYDWAVLDEENASLVGLSILAFVRDINYCK